MHPPHAHPDQLTCRDLLELLLHYAEGETSAEVAALCEQHLELCRECREYLASYQETRRLSRAAADEADAFPEELLEQILAAAGAHSTPR